MKEVKKALDKAIDRLRFSAVGTIISVIKGDNTVAIEKFDEEIRDVSIVSPYGLYSLPINGLNGQVIINNTTKSATLVGVEQTTAPIEIEPGETLLYCNTDSYIHLKEGKIFIKGDIEVQGKVTEVPPE